MGADPDDLMADTHVWVNGNQCRPGVDYLLNPGDELVFGEAGSAPFMVVVPEAKGGSAAMEMMMKGMLSGASDEVKKAME